MDAQNDNNAASPLLIVDIQCALDLNDADHEEPPSEQTLTAWAQLAYTFISDSNGEVTIRLVSKSEMMALNLEYRDKPTPTNVLSFPVENDAEFMDNIEIPLIGDIVICHSVVEDEAKEQHKSLDNHYAHMVTHGILHLCGFDHQDEQSAERMESLETEILEKNSIPNPYHY